MVNQMFGSGRVLWGGLDIGRVYIYVNINSGYFYII